VQAQTELLGEARRNLQPNERIKFNYPATEGVPPNWTGMASAIVSDVAFSEEVARVEN